MPLSLDRFYETVREERLFCAILYHLLLQSDHNIATFIDAINEQLDDGLRLASPGDDAHIYVEFTYLRDSWYAMGSDNTAKRAFIFDLFSRSSVLATLAPDTFPPATSCADFNAHFMGPSGRRITSDIASPRLWSVKSLRESFRDAGADVFRELCRFKWAFNIKPDLVIVAPGVRPICVEAKLESREGSYPTSNDECAIFDELFGQQEQRRVKQVELQTFMFETLLGTPCQPVVVGRKPIGGQRPVLVLELAVLSPR